MATDLVMPRLSDSMEEGTIIQWLKAVGDEVAAGDELVEIETDKANMVYEADTAGTLVEILAEEGYTLPIGEVIARVGEAGEAATPGASALADEHPVAPSAIRESAASAEQAPTQPASAPRAAGEPGDGGRVKASPLARRVAADAGVDLSALAGSGPGGRVVKGDVERAAASGPAAPAPMPAAPTPGAGEGPETAKGSVEIVELTKLQQTVGRRMAESKATAPHFYLTIEVDMSRCVAARAKIKGSAAAGEVVPSFNDMVVKACALTLREFPRANGAYRDGRWELYSRVNVGIAVAGEEALVVPTIFDADRKGLRQIAAEARALAARVRDGQITPPELSGGTFTTSNLGMFGVTEFAAVINPPQAGILSVGAIIERPIVADGQIATAHMMAVGLAGDHRILNGAEGAEFLAAVRRKLEEPLALAL